VRAAHDVDDYVMNSGIVSRLKRMKRFKRETIFLDSETIFAHAHAGEFEAVAIVGSAHGLEPAGHALGVAVLAARADLGAAGQRTQHGSWSAFPGPGRWMPMLISSSL